MKISALRIINYKGFLDSGFISLDPKWNVVIGQNNAGKTTFIEGFRCMNGIEDKPHRSISSPRGTTLPPKSRVVMQLVLSRELLKSAWASRGGQFHIPYGHNKNGKIERLIDPCSFWSGPDLNVEIELDNSASRSRWPSHRLFDEDKDYGCFAVLSFNEKMEIITDESERYGGHDTLPDIVRLQLKRSVYVFDAKRFSTGECVHEDTTILKSDASNLPAVLMKMSGNPHLFNEYKQNVRNIFPGIKGVAPIPHQSGFQIRLWTVDEDSRREDLTVPLSESGAGIGQVLAILYVAMTSNDGVIAIDEPNSFLHPGAAKKLIQTLKKYSNNQYIISSHSPDVISASIPSSVLFVRSMGNESVIEYYSERQFDMRRIILDEVGASLSDVFSSDKVVWVEGPTEKECFDIITKECLSGPIVGLSFVALRNTGDLEGRQADAALDIYEALSNGGAMLPVSLAWSFDRESKTDRQMDDIRRRCRGRAHFLPRRMTENFLLDPISISYVLRELGETKVSDVIVAELLRRHAPEWMPKEVAYKYGDESFYKEVDGANLLNVVFNEASESRCNYRKVRDGARLLKLILERDRSSVKDLIEFVKVLVGPDDPRVDTEV